MNTVHIELNSYIHEVRFFVNGVQTDPYSALSNFTYEQVLKNPKEILTAVSRELNDDFDLALTATDWEYAKIEDVAFDFDDCNSCSAIQPSIKLTTKERAEKLGEHLPSQTVFVLSADNLSTSRSYGNLTLCFTNDSEQASYKELVAESDILSAAETLIINPIIGSAAKSAAAKDSTLAICYSLSPVVTVSFPQKIQAGEDVKVCVSTFPEGHPAPAVSIRSSNPDIASVEENVIHAVTTGMTNIQVFHAGESVPFYSQKIRVEKNIYVSRIEIPTLSETLPEGKTIDLNILAFPPDASDIDEFEFHSSSPDIAEFVGKQLKLNTPGECVISVTGRKFSYSKAIQVSARLKEYILSVDHVELNLGQKYPIEVQCVPEICYNSAYTWLTSDKTVAIVVEEDEQLFIKAIGMGNCIITCKSSDNSVKATCTAAVRSAMYKKKPKPDYKKSAAAVMSIARGFTSSTKKMIGSVSEKAESAFTKKTSLPECTEDAEDTE